MSASLTLIGLVVMLLLALGCTALVLVATILSLMPPELEDRHERHSGQSSERGLQRYWKLLWQREGNTLHAAPGLARAERGVRSGHLPPRGRPR
jgi:hypothetical protein